jgi:hypothetical protein
LKFLARFWVYRDFEYVGILSVRDFEIRDFEGEPFPQTHFNQPQILTQKGSNYNPTKKQHLEWRTSILSIIPILNAFINFNYLQSNLVTLIWLTFSWARDLKFCTHV